MASDATCDEDITSNVKKAGVTPKDVAVLSTLVYFRTGDACGVGSHTGRETAKLGIKDFD